MLQAVQLKLERVAHEFADWQAVPEAERSPAPPWWWGVAIETMNETDQISPELCQLLDIPAGATYAHASAKLINALSSQTTLPPPDEFPRKRQSLELKSMATFDPNEPAILHDRVSDKTETWTVEEASDYRQNTVSNPDGTVEWRHFVFDGWGNVLGG